MKTNLLSVVGGLLLLGCAIFAFARLGTADQWIASWTPFVIVGAALGLAGALVMRRKSTRHSRRD